MPRDVGSSAVSHGPLSQDPSAPVCRPDQRRPFGFQKLALALAAASLTAAIVSPVRAQTSGNIKIGVISEAQAVAGSSIPQAAQLAADEINAAGGVNGKIV